MTGITIYNVRRVKTLKVGNLELWFLCSAHHIMVVYICISFKKTSQTFSSNRADTYVTEITIFNVQRAITPNVG